MGQKKLGVISVALITYFNVSGGPWGSEPIVAACGPLVGIIATLTFPFIWCLPLALSFAELFSAFPTDSSFCTWVGKAFGRPMGFYVGYWSWVAGVIDNAIYPCLMVDSIHAVLVGPEVVEKTLIVPLWMYIVRLIVATMFMLPTIFSIDAVGRFLLVLGIAMVLPFIVLVVVAIPQVNPANWFLISPEPDFRRLFSMLYWSYSGFDAAGAYAGAIDDPRRTYPRAMMLTVALVAMTYSIPFFAASGVNQPPYETWSDGFYPIIAEAIAGPMLRSWFLCCAIMGNMGVYIAKMTKNGFQLAGMADLGLAPSYFIERTSSNGVPRRAILLSYLIIVFMALFDFNVILGVDNFLSSLACVTELCAVVRLRWKLPKLERPYKVNLTDRGLFCAMIIPLSLGTFVMVNEFTKSKLSVCLNLIALTCGLIYHRFLRSSPSYVYSPMSGGGPLEKGLDQQLISPGGTSGISGPSPLTAIVSDEEIRRFDPLTPLGGGKPLALVSPTISTPLIPARQEGTDEMDSNRNNSSTGGMLHRSPRHSHTRVSGSRHSRHSHKQPPQQIDTV
jgi:amino acid transporter